MPDSGCLAGNIESMWRLPFELGRERSCYAVYLNNMVSHRLSLSSGFTLINDELFFSSGFSGIAFRNPCVVTALAHTTCGDRVNQGEPEEAYFRSVIERFATRSEIGLPRVERFYPAGGGVADAMTLAHVTVNHALDKPIRERLFQLNDRSFCLYNFDVKSHVGRHAVDGRAFFGLTSESEHRQPRFACGAVIGALKHFDETNMDHIRIVEDLGRRNFEYLVSHGSFTEEGVDITYAVASAIVSIRGVENLTTALKTEIGERSACHLTASLIVNKMAKNDNIVLLAEATLQGSQLTIIGLGTDAGQFSGRLDDEGRLVLSYAGRELGGFRPRRNSKF